MANRHLSRSVVLQALFEWDARSYPSEQAVGVLDRDIAEFASGTGDSNFSRTLLMGVLEKQAEIDDIIVKAAPEWPIPQISLVDRNVLRIGLYELLYEDRNSVPAKVAINEAIELAKTFGGETSGKFVNGVLGTIYKELGEPGKEEATKAKKKRNEPLDLEKCPIDRMIGAIIFAKYQGEIYLAFVHDVFGFWTLSKGKLQPGEEISKGVVRKVSEEVSLPVQVVKEVGKNEYLAQDPVRGKVRKQVSYLLVQSPYQAIKLKKSGGLDDARWFSLSDVEHLEMYDDMRPIVAEAIGAIPH